MPPTPIKTSKVCLNCSKSFSRSRYNARLEDFTRFNKRKFCSLTCSASYNNRRIEPGEGYYRRKSRVYLGKCCDSCRSTNKLVVHHIDQNYKNNSPSNLQTLCNNCHDHWHWHQRKLGINIAGPCPKKETWLSEPSVTVSYPPSRTALRELSAGWKE